MKKRYELTLKASYLPGWDLWAGLRELAQNARDAEVEFSAPMKIEHVFRIRNKEPIGTVIICNEGATIPIEALLIGHTSKANRSDLMGKFGEGLKFGILALLRLGLQVKIRNGDQSWDPIITRSKDYDAEVLAFDVTSGNKFENRVQIEILGVTIQEWQDLQERFLFLNQPHPASFVQVYGGKVLLSPQYKGMLFVKGMYVCQSSQLFFGYDVDEADIDRDRRMVSDVASVTGKLLSAALASGKLTDKVYELLSTGSAETSGISHWSLEDTAKESIVKKFQDQYGPDAVAIESEDQAVELGHLGARGIKVPWNLQSIISSKLGTAKDTISRLKMNTRHVFDLRDLEDTESHNLNRAREILKFAVERNNFPLDMCDRIKIVDFNDPKLRGTYSSSERIIRLARNQLESLPSVLRTLIHEMAHYHGPDGTKQHEAAIGQLTEATFEFLLNQ